MGAIKTLHTFLGKVRQQPEFLYSLWSLSGQFVVSVAMFLMTYVLANYVSPATVGEFRFVISFFSSVSVFTLIGISTALTHSVAAGKPHTLKYAYLIKIKYGLVGTVAFWALAGYYWQLDNTTFAWGLLIAGICLPFLEAGALHASYLKGKSNFSLASKYLAVQRVALSAGVILVAFFNPNIAYLIIAYFLIQAIVNSFLYQRTVSELKTDDGEKASEKVDKSMLPYAKHLTLMSVIGSITSQLDKYIMYVFFGPVALAGYWVASVVPQEIGRGIAIIVSTMFPRMVRGSESENQILLRRLFVFSGAIMLAGSFLYMLAAPLLFGWFLPNYTNMISISIGLMFAYACVPHLFLWQNFTAEKKVKGLYIFSTAEPLLQAGLFLLLVPIFGVWGVVYALLSKMLILNLTAFILLYVKK